MRNPTAPYMKRNNQNVKVEKFGILDRFYRIGSIFHT